MQTAKREQRGIPVVLSVRSCASWKGGLPNFIPFAPSFVHPQDIFKAANILSTFVKVRPHLDRVRTSAVFLTLALLAPPLDAPVHLGQGTAAMRTPAVSCTLLPASTHL